MTKKKIGIGFIGAGGISIIHGEAVTANNRAKLVGIWNRTESRGIERAKQFSCKTYKTPEELVSDPEIDAVFILTNLETHLEYAKLAMENGKNVLIEKPVANSLDEVKEVKSIAEKTGVVCMPGHNVIYDDGVTRMKKMIQSGDIGKLISFYYLFNALHTEEIAQLYPGVIRQMLTHNLYTMLYLAGVPKQVMAMKSCLHYEKLTREDLVMVILKLKNDSLAHLEVSFAADDLSSDPWTLFIKVLGTEGSGVYTWNDWVLSKKGITHSREYVAYPGAIVNEVNHFINICTNGGKPLSTIDDAIKAQAIMEAIELSVDKKIAVDLQL
ncbi:MAG: Gfo/Idh/MocA family oxidoreductase [Actinobacteria bacterium]|nr:Gfo/Idh/MocA family oxidoreductase [Actinomycetota bacterium]